MRKEIVAVLLFLVGSLSAGAETSTSDSELPKVLIIGDSISIGYTSYVRELLKGEAVVKHNQGNAKYTWYGLQNLDKWLGDESWDVIHFNWGLWDLCYRHPDSKVQGKRDKANGTVCASPEEYGRNLEKLVERLEKTGAVLIWANTTVVPEGEAGRFVDDDLKYNQVAEAIMKKHNIRMNDLNALTRTFSAELFLGPGNVHYVDAGYEKLAVQVVEEIHQALSAEN